MNIKLIQPYSKNAFRIWLTQDYSKEQLKAARLRAFTVKKIYFILCGSITPKNPIVFNKSIAQLALMAGCCKQSALKALKFLEEHRFIKIDYGRGRKSNTYKNLLKETGIMSTKNLKQLPYISIKDYLLLKDLAEKKIYNRAALLLLANIMVWANKNSGLFLASKETLEKYTQLDRRTIDSHFKRFKADGILTDAFFPGSSGEKNPYRRGQNAYKLNRAVLIDLVKPKNVTPAPVPKKESNFGAPENFLDEVKQKMNEYRAGKSPGSPQKKSA